MTILVSGLSSNENVLKLALTYSAVAYTIRYTYPGQGKCLICPSTNELAP